MSSRIRWVALLGTTAYAGGPGLQRMIKLWQKYHTTETKIPPAKGMERVLFFYAGVPVTTKGLIVFREHRGMRRHKSMYMHLGQQYGITNRRYTVRELNAVRVTMQRDNRTGATTRGEAPFRRPVQPPLAATMRSPALAERINRVQQPVPDFELEDDNG